MMARGSFNKIFPYNLHVDASSFFSAQGAEKLIADNIQLHFMNYLHAQVLFCSYFTRWCKSCFALCIFVVSDAKLQALGSIKNNIQKLAVDDIFPIGVILMGRV